MIETVEGYWDCECEDHYIQPVELKKCKKCGAFEEDMPESREDEMTLANMSMHAVEVWAEDADIKPSNFYIEPVGNEIDLYWDGHYVTSISTASNEDLFAKLLGLEVE